LGNIRRKISFKNPGFWNAYLKPFDGNKLSVVIMDNAFIHHFDGVEHAVEHNSQAKV